MGANYKSPLVSLPATLVGVALLDPLPLIEEHDPYIFPSMESINHTPTLSYLTFLDEFSYVFVVEKAIS